MEISAKIYVAGHNGMVGSAIVRELRGHGYENLLLKSSRELDLRDQVATFAFFESEKPDYVFMAAAKVGGILINSQKKGEFFYDNMAIELNTIEGARRAEVKKFCFLGSSCIYPKLAPQPIKEEYLMTGHLEPTNFGYATAKIAGVQMCETYFEQYGFKYVALMPCNLYGPGDNFNPNDSHVLGALLRKTVEAKERGDTSISMWGTGNPRREFLYVDDVARVCLFLMENDIDRGMFNVGAGTDLTINELAQKIFEVVGFAGSIEHDLSKPNGTPRKLLDVSKLMNLGWKPTVPLEEGIKLLYEWFLEHR